MKEDGFADSGGTYEDWFKSALQWNLLSPEAVRRRAAVRELFNLPNVNPKNLPAKENTLTLYGGPGVGDENPVVTSYLGLVQTNVEAALAARRGPRGYGHRE